MTRPIPTVRATAPTRVDLAGGTLDLWPLSQLVDRAVTVNLAIDVMTGCEMRPRASGWVIESRGRGRLELDALPARPEREVPPGFALAAVALAHLDVPPCHVTTWSDAAPGSGLGGSSSLLIALLAAGCRFISREMGDSEAVGLACNLETRVLRLPAGSQDHWAARCGGLAVLEYGPEGVVRHAEGGAAATLGEALVVADTLVEHHSGMNNWAVLRAVLEGDSEASQALAQVSAAAATMRDVVVSGSTGDDLLAAAAAALAEEWRSRRRLSPAVSSPEVERVVAAAEAAGGAAKVCGAGGGGCVACLPSTAGGRDALVRAVAATGARVLTVRPSGRGVRTELVGGS